MEYMYHLLSCELLWTYICNNIVPGQNTLINRGNESLSKGISKGECSLHTHHVASHMQSKSKQPTIVRSKLSMVAPTRFMISPKSQMYRKTSDRDSPDFLL